MAFRNSRRSFLGSFGLSLLALTGCGLVPATGPAVAGQPAVGAATESGPGTVAAPGAAPTPTVPPDAILKTDWFNLRPQTASHWALQPDGRDRLRFTLAPRQVDAVAQRPRRVLVLFSKASLSYDVALSKIADVFQTKHIPARFTAVNYQNEAPLGQKALDEAVADRYDLMLSMGSDATEFAWKRFEGAPVPVVSVCSKDPVLLGQLKDYQTGSGTNFAYTSLNVPIELQVAYLMQLRKGLKNVAVMYSESNKSARETQAEPLKPVAATHRIRVIDVAVREDRRAREELAVGVPRAVDEMRASDPELAESVFLITGDTTVFNQIETINRGAGTVPVLSVVPDVVKEGENSAVLSIGVSFGANAYLAALYAGDILLGRAQPGELKVGIVSPPDIAINFRKARQIGLRIPLSFFESASDVYDYDGRPVRIDGQAVRGR